VRRPDEGSSGTPPRRPPPDERVVWRRWLWGGLAVIFLGWFIGSFTVSRTVRTPGPPVTSDLPEAVALDRPLQGVDVSMDRGAWREILALEDARAPSADDERRIAQRLDHPAPGLRRAAARALGRLERPHLLELLAPALEDGDPLVRAEVANALAQAANAGDDPRPARDVLEARLRDETDPRVQGALVRALGRLRPDPGLPEGVGADLEARAMRLLEVAALPPDDPGGVLHEERMLGVARGAFFLFRSAGAATAGGASWEGEARDRLEEAMERIARTSAFPGAVRRAAAGARIAAGPASAGWAEALLGVDDAELRRMGALAARERSTVEMALADGDATVRVEGIRRWAADHAAGASSPGEGCAPLVAALDDPSDHVALAALEALGEVRCGAAEGDRLRALAEELVGDRGAGGGGTGSSAGWHRPVRALQSLARQDPSRALPLLLDAAEYPDPFVRAHVARMAGRLAATEPRVRPLLRRLAADPSANVREAALSGITALPGPEADSILVAQLADPDPQLVRTAAQLLAGRSASPERTEALFRALDFFTSGRRATDRDPRLAVLDRLGEVWDGTEADVQRLDPWVSDPDPRVATAAARVVERWTGLRREARPQGELPGLALPDWDELRGLESGVLVLELEEGGLEGVVEVRIRLLPFEAPTSAARVARLAREGALDGLTLHRVAPNFVVQGGSPGANEYAGHGAYTRDELGRLGHWQGTVGVSTRGRDTGDGQLFVNLVDNLRLDHDYTVFGVVVEGMPWVASVQEGVRIRTARWAPW
jgi:cyclophilin family peptidyl-prolyl cis-trans isomerase/HEAT repeat protein